VVLDNLSIEKELPVELISNPLKDLSKDKNITLQQILNNLLDATNNLELKSHIYKPKALSGLKIIADDLLNNHYVNSANLILNYITTYLKYMISYERKSRTEVIKALTFSYRNESMENDFVKNLD